MSDDFTVLRECMIHGVNYRAGEKCPVCITLSGTRHIPPLARGQVSAPKENPKLIQAQKDGKAPMELVPWGPMEAVARVMAGGAAKYGRFNWRIDHIRASTYIGAEFRHAFLQWAQGIDKDEDSGEHPLAHVIACCLIVMDAEAHDTLIDDRNHAESKSNGESTK